MRNLRVQLLISHLILVVLLGVVMSSLVRQYFQLDHSMNSVVTRNVPGMLAAQKLEQDIARQEGCLRLILEGRLEQASRDFEASWPSYVLRLKDAQTTSTPDTAVTLNQLTVASTRYEAEMRSLFSLPPNVDSDEVQRRFSQRIRPTLDKINATTSHLILINGTEMSKASQAIRLETQRAAAGSIIVTVLTLILAICLAYIVVRLALDPLRRVARQAELIGQGDFSHRIPQSRTDELGQLASTFNQMAQKLEQLREAERLKLQRAEQMADAALTFMYDPVVVTDAKGRIAFLNKAAEGLWGPSPASPRVPIIEQVGDRRIVRAIEHAIKDGKVTSSDDDTAMIPIRVGDAERTYRLRANPMTAADGTVLGCVVVLEDMSHQMEVDRLKNQFIGVASHELKTPVQSLLLSAQLLLEGAAGDLSNSQKEVVELQLQDLERLDKLTRELLDITRLEAGTNPPRLELVAPADLLQQVWRNLHHKADARQLSLNLVESPDLFAVPCDRTQIGRVLLNLTDNAIRHTPKGGAVTLRAIAGVNHVTFSVEDTGEGIPPQYLQSIFERFVQVPGATSGGAGLGLSIAQTILKGHGSELRVESEVGKGSRFSFDLSRDHLKSTEEKS